ncbi:hypothetical protein PPYR_14130 [Photinus pyralis]|uniref:MSP domain-containing protein n=1 Tax=Photinus pyralis TaxID=7054 RepID=A0A1Y1N4U2_PHOPY|nr:vesicle-associated membrane protein-associated protein B [Photinus pyralis]KAB0792171.1 hypothetical protein PPYR_14130 [Photinus pyralis]
MAKPEQVLTIEPQNELRFRGPFSVPVTSYMKLTNPSDRKVLFKIKTTAPKKYCVRPNSGILEPSSNAEIAICLQPFVFDPVEKNKHKFMVQTVYAPDSDANLEQLWKDINPEQMMDSKLKCVFELPPDQADAPAAEEPAKVSPKPTQQTFVPAAHENLELEEAAVEVQQLREEESLLRQENLRLKEEILRLKHSANVGQPQLSKYTPNAVQPQGISVAYLVAGIAIAIFGIIMGKFIL